MSANMFGFQHNIRREDIEHQRIDVASCPTEYGVKHLFYTIGKGYSVLLYLKTGEEKTVDTQSIDEAVKVYNSYDLTPLGQKELI